VPTTATELAFSVARRLAVAEAGDHVMVYALRESDPAVAEHCRRVGDLAAATSGALGMDPARVERVRLAGMVHDIGKNQLSRAVLDKPGRLTAQERAHVERHPLLGAALLPEPGHADLRAWVLAHHERPDGEGYPMGLGGGEIPLEALILAVADAYDAMTGERVYRSPLSHRAACVELCRGAGTQFDSAVTQAFLEVVAVARPRGHPASQSTV